MHLTPPKSYLCYKTESPLQIDGTLNKPAWHQAAWTDDFVDIEGDIKPLPRFRTRAKMLWDDTYFYIGAEMEEPHVWATLTEHDSVIFQDNDFEVFIDPDGDNHHYYEFEINALGTYWDLRLPMPYKDGGSALNEWEIPGLLCAVHVDGTLNDATDIDRGWSVEIAFPWEVLAEYADCPAPPHDGNQWRVNFSRVEWHTEIVNGEYRKIPDTPEDNWVWSPQGVIDMHRPERWGYVQFSNAKPGSAVFCPDPTLPAREILHQIYYAQHRFRFEHHRWADSFEELNLQSFTHESLAEKPELVVDSGRFRASAIVKYPDGTFRQVHIRQDSRIEVKPL